MKSKLYVKEICQNKGMTMKDLAELLNVSPSALSQTITSENPGVATLESISKALNVSFLDLFKEPGDGPSKVKQNKKRKVQTKPKELFPLFEYFNGAPYSLIGIYTSYEKALKVAIGEAQEYVDMCNMEADKKDRICISDIDYDGLCDVAVLIDYEDVSIKEHKTPMEDFKYVILYYIENIENDYPEIVDFSLPVKDNGTPKVPELVPLKNNDELLTSLATVSSIANNLIYHGKNIMMTTLRDADFTLKATSDMTFHPYEGEEECFAGTLKAGYYSAFSKRHISDSSIYWVDGWLEGSEPFITDTGYKHDRDECINAVMFGGNYKGVFQTFIIFGAVKQK